MKLSNYRKEQKKHECTKLINYKKINCKSCDKYVLGCADDVCCSLIDKARETLIEEIKEKIYYRFRGNYQYNSIRLKEIIKAILEDI
jgi:hypothetical protein